MTTTDALGIARLWAAYKIGDPAWASDIADILNDPTTADAWLRTELGDDYDRNLYLANRSR